jgi:hypothetical protein
MAPAAKRKKPGEDPAKPAAAKARAKRPRIESDPGAAIETPPPTPKPAPGVRGLQPAAAQITKVNGKHATTNGTASVALGDAIGADKEDEVMADATAVQPPPASLKRTSTEDDTEAGAAVNGHQNGLRPSQEPLHASSNNVSANPASRPPTTNGHVPSTGSDAVRPTTEQHTNMEQPAARKQKIKSKEREMRDRLYQYCIKAKPIGEIYSIEELKRADVTQNDQDLLDMCQQLVTHFLFSAMTLNRGIVYKTRSYEVAKK